MEVWISKLISLLAMFILSLLFGLVPIKLVEEIKTARNDGRSRIRFDQLMSLLNCFAGGVFFGTTLLHLLPDVRYQAGELLESFRSTSDFALGEFLIAIGFFIVMGLEHFVMVLQHHNSDVPFRPGIDLSDHSSSCCDDEPCDRDGRLAGCHCEPNDTAEESLGLLKNTYYKNYDTCCKIVDLRSEEKCKISFENIDKPNASLEDGTVEQSGLIGHDKPIAAACMGETEQFGRSLDSLKHKTIDSVLTVRPRSRTEPGVEDSNHDTNQHHHHHHTSNQPEIPDMLKPLLAEDGACIHVIEQNHHEHHHNEVTQLGGVRAFILLLAMSLHTVFEGLAIGLQTDSADVWKLFLAVIIHKCIISFSLGLQFSENLQHPKSAVLFVGLFAMMSPLGVGVGTAVTELASGTGEDLLITQTILEAIAAGTFLYVTFFEVLLKEVGQDHGLIKVLMVIAGFTVMTILNLFT